MTHLLSPDHLKKLHEDRSIALALIQQRGYQSLPQPEDLIDRGFSKAQAKTAPALGIPLWDVHGRRRYWQIRPDSPRQFKDGRLAKYELPQGEHLLLDVHPSVQPLIGDPHAPLWITEGIPKGDALASRGICTIALNGVRGYRGSNEFGGKVILPDWEHVALNGREVYVVYDSDIYQKPDVELALKGLYAVLRPRGAIPRLVVWPEAYRQSKVGVDDFFAQGHTLEELLAMVPKVGPLPLSPACHRNGSTPDTDPSQAWRKGLLTTKGGDPFETLGNIMLTLEHLDPWQTQCWYDEVRDICMVGNSPLTDTLVTQARLALERTYRIPMRSKSLVPCALTYLCFQRPRDLLREWLETLAPWDQTPRLTEWLHDCAHAPKTAYGMDVSRLLIVSLVARALTPGCQYRYVVILEGPENTGKSRLVEELGTPEWYREISHGLEGKEAHMRVKRAWVAELAELASFSKTEDARLKAFFTLKDDTYVPKFANFEVQHQRRTIFVGTHNPEGDNTYFRGQTGNTRYLPIPVSEVQIEDFVAVREQLFAEALAYYRAHPGDWWHMSGTGDAEAMAEREERRQSSPYESDLGMWLERTASTVVWWERLAVEYLELPRDKWGDRRTQMEISKALFALGWRKGKRERLPSIGLVVPWRKGEGVNRYEQQV